MPPLSIDERIDRVVDRAHPRSVRPIKCSEWAARHVRLSSESSSVEGPLTPMPFQAVWLDLFGMDGGPEKIVIAKAARCGYTEALKASMCYLLAEVRRNIIGYQPTDVAAKEWARDTVGPALRDCDVTAELMEEFEGNSVQTHQWVGGKGISIRGAKSPTNFRRIGADCVLMDEVDGFDISVAGEGSPVSLASRALVTSRFRKLLVGSTPTDAGVSLVWDEFMSAECKFLYYAKCPHCGKLSPLDFERLRWNKTGKPAARVESVRYQCAKCRRNWRQDALPAALAAGRWEVPPVIAGQDVDEYVGAWIKTDGIAPELVGAKGEALPWPHSIGFHVWRAYSTLSPWQDIPRDLLRARGNPLLLKVFTNHVRGLPWGGDLHAKTPGEITKMRKAIKTLPAEATQLYLAVDCQKDFLSVMLLAFSQTMDCWILSRDELTGNPELDDGEAWSQLYDWLRGGVSWPRKEPSGRLSNLPLLAMAVDTGGLYTQATYRACMRLAAVCPNVIPTKGGSIYNAPVVKRSSTTTEQGIKIPLFNVGTHRAKILASQVIGKNRMVLNQTCPTELDDELVAERLVLRRREGRMAYKWEDIGGRMKGGTRW